MGTDFIYYTASSISVVSKNCQNCCNKGKSFSTVIFFCNSLVILRTVINHSNSTHSRCTKITVVPFRHEICGLVHLKCPNLIVTFIWKLAHHAA